MNKNSFIKTSILFFLLFIATHLNAQTGIFFQAIARDMNANPSKDRKIYVQTNIIQTSPTGTIVLMEEHQTYTDAFGIFSIMVGGGTRVGGTVAGLSTIDWSKGPYYLNLKIVVTPIGVGAGWDYTKEWVDIGTTIFGTVPYALYSSGTAKFDEKLNITDTSKMLGVYAKAQVVQNLSSAINTKLSLKDTMSMLAPYAKINFTIDSFYFKQQLATKLNNTDSLHFTKKNYTDSALLTKMNTFDTSIYAKQIFVDAVNNAQHKYIDLSLETKFNLTDTIKYAKQAYTDSALLIKMNIYDTSVYAKKIPVDAALASKFNITDTIKYTKQNYTDSALLTKMNIYDTSVYAKKIPVDAALASKFNITDTIKYTKQNYTDSALLTKFNITDISNFTKKSFTDSALLTKLTITGSAAGLTNFPILNQNTTGNAATATYANSTNTANTAITAVTAGNITATSNTTLTSLNNLNTVGTITNGVWSATTIDIAHGGTGLITSGTSGQILITTESGTLTWTNSSTLTGAHYIGESYGGGIVFYVYENGKHGLIVSSTDQSTGVYWSKSSSYTTTNAVRDGVNGGMANTERIIFSQGTGNYAAQVAANYKGGGFGDWYLPSITELNLLYAQRQLMFSIGYSNTYYWSSNENPSNNNQAWAYNFTGSGIFGLKYYNSASVRAIRSF
jgi:Protein of unknown function (DUF1566)